MPPGYHLRIRSPRVSVGRIKKPLAVVLATLAAVLSLAGGAAATSSSDISAYTAPAPTPAPDTVAKAFVAHVAPSLRHVDAKKLAQGIEVVKPTPSSAKSEPPRRLPGRRDELFLGRAGVGESDGGFDSRWGFLLAGALTLAGFGVCAAVTLRPSPRITR